MEDQLSAGRGRRKASTTRKSPAALPPGAAEAARARWMLSPSRMVTKTVGMLGSGWMLGSAPMVMYMSQAQHTCGGWWWRMREL